MSLGNTFLDLELLEGLVFCGCLFSLFTERCHLLTVRNVSMLPVLQTVSSQTKNVTPSLCHLNCCNSPAVSNTDKWSLYLGRWQASLLQGFRPWRLAFLNACKYPFWIVFPGCWRSWSLPLWSSGCTTQQSEVHQSPLVSCLIYALHKTLLAAANPSGNAEKAGNSSLVLELHLQWVISVFSARLGFPV